VTLGAQAVVQADVTAEAAITLGAYSTIDGNAKSAADTIVFGLGAVVKGSHS
jgi:hypothetical protein